MYRRTSPWQLLRFWLPVRRATSLLRKQLGGRTVELSSPNPRPPTHPGPLSPQSTGQGRDMQNDTMTFLYPLLLFPPSIVFPPSGPETPFIETSSPTSRTATDSRPNRVGRNINFVGPMSRVHIFVQRTSLLFIFFIQRRKGVFKGLRWFGNKGINSKKKLHIPCRSLTSGLAQ